MSNYSPTPAPWPVLVRHIDGSEILGITWRRTERGRTITCPGCAGCDPGKAS